MAWACTMPEELSVVPRGLVCLANLDTRHHAVHRAIWELLDKERTNASIRYRLVDIDEQYSHSKAKVRLRLSSPVRQPMIVRFR